MRITVMPPVGRTRSNAQWPGEGPYGTLIANGLPSALAPFNTITDPAWNPCLYSIAYDTETQKATASFTLHPVNYEGVVNAKAGKETEGFRIGFPALPDASGYIVTVKRRNSSGSEYFVDGYNEKLVTVNNPLVRESSAMMNQENQFTIRAMGQILPSTKVLTVNGIPFQLGEKDTPQHQGVPVRMGKAQHPPGLRQKLGNRRSGRH